MKAYTLKNNQLIKQVHGKKLKPQLNKMKGEKAEL